MTSYHCIYLIYFSEIVRLSPFFYILLYAILYRFKVLNTSYQYISIEHNTNILLLLFFIIYQSFLQIIDTLIKNTKTYKSVTFAENMITWSIVQIINKFELKTSELYKKISNYIITTHDNNFYL